MKTNLTRKDAQERAELISNVRYDIAVDITGADAFTTVSTVHFDSKAGTTHFDLVAAGFEATLDGEETGQELSLDDGAHTLVVTSHDAYNRTGEGLHKFTDPVDGKDYLYTQFEPAMAMKVFAGFDQPDLKATYKVSVKAPERYTVILNEAVERTDNGDGTSTCTTVIDYPLSTYLIAICAGEFERISDTYDAGDGRTIELGLYARASLIPHMDSERLFRQTKDGFDFYHANFGRTYPFGDKYDQVFCPEYNMGAMEHVGCVTYRDEYVFTSEPTPYRLERRNDTILHEMAHMWFGDLVTMQWWDDLWLNESFATWSAATAQTAIGEYADAWTTFASVEKAWAYQQDQLPSTHPIAADAPDIETAEQNFDGITYAKGASVLKQLQAYVGYEEFFAGVRRHFDNHAYSNATFDDLLGALEEASGRDLSGWAEQWLRTTGPSTLRPEIGESFAVLQEDPRPHRVRVGLYKLVDGSVTRVKQIETDIDGERTEIPELAGIEHALAIVNDDDLTYAKMRLTPEHQKFALEHIGEIEDSLARTVIWSSLWESVRDGELAAREFVKLVAAHAAAETHPSVQERLLAQATQAVRQYVDPAWQGEGMDLLNAAFRGAQPAAIFDRALARLTPTEDTVAYFKELLARSDNQEVRWLAITNLIAAGALPLEAAEKEQDNTSEGAISRLRARAVVDKRWAWQKLVEDDLTNLEARYLMDGLTFTYDGLEGLTDEYFRAAPALWERLTNEMAQRTLEGMYPRWDVTAGAVEKANALLNGDAPAGLKRVIAEGQDRIARAVRNREVDATSA
ncbi:aminopeptidase N [Corynebacterium afermentans subsp. lipophilum]|uniref:aminopeptidase N n=1 Tax=Corynebacterium afermentans TaxID=38286 RepID=UPI00188CEBF2|nr:aminopeptidase N [Corynebacterium afermentans]MBF4547117.1 aminopeptidase N [Corynebacterium afermentans subsp. lipophilum]WJY59479.1 Aminopeptidase N [Corynebacterium afermentans subsp. lipophilum]